MKSIGSESTILQYLGDDSHHCGVIRTEYSAYAANQANRISKLGIDDQAVRRLYQEGISVDGIESKDLDDAIWAERTKFGYVVFVHISDVTEAVRPYTPLDIEALKRTTSIYRGETVLNMFPPVLSQNLLSLDENGEKLTLSLKIELDHDGKIRNYSVYESVFKNLRRYDYESFLDDFMDPDSKHHGTLQLMYEIATRRRGLRRQEGATMDFDESDRQVSVERTDQKISSRKKAIPTSIIEEFMILANIASATLAVKKEYNSIFRLHAGKEERAYYHNADGIHNGLALQHYTHFTSPIRRYADMVVHRVLKQVHLRKEPHPYTREEIGDIAKHINVSRALTEILSRNIDAELLGAKLVARVRGRNPGEQLNVSHFTQSIRDMVGSGKTIPSAVVKEILHDLENGEKSNWAWAIGVLLVSKNDEIRQGLKKALLDDKKFRARSVLSLLNGTKVGGKDGESLFEVIETEQDGSYTLEVLFRGKRFTRRSIDFGSFEKNDAIGRTRSVVVKKIVEHFCQSQKN